jgi:hypothetical protein
MNLFLIPGGGIATVLTLFILTSIYFYLGFALFNGIRFRQIFKKESFKGISNLKMVGAVGTGFSLSMIIIGILFFIQSWPDPKASIIMGLTLILIIMTISLFKYWKTRSKYYKNILIRIVIIASIGLVVLFIPRTKYIEFKFRDHPAYLEAYKKAIADPQNEILWENVDKERQKIDTQEKK